MKPFHPLILAPILSLGCVEPSTSVTILSKNAYPSKPNNCEIQILTQPPSDRRFEELAVLTSITGDPFYGEDLNALLPSMKAKACALGADAILLKQAETGGKNLRYSHGKAFSVAIKFIE